jgi:hypothetical protein
MKNYNLSSVKSRSAIVTRLALATLVIALPLRILAGAEQQFDSPDAAVTALTNAAIAKDTNAMMKIFGPEGETLVNPDVVQASQGFEVFTKRISEKVEMSHESNSRIILNIGSENWPFAIPLVMQDNKWFFDVAAGKEEILNRRIGSDELGAIAVCQTYVQAQREFAMRDRNDDGIIEYAQHLRSAQGKRDGLYWPAKNPTDEISPLGPLISEAREEGYHGSTGLMTDSQEKAKQTPYHGYYFKVLTKQGKNAPGGKYDYVINGHMVAGFALIAWPAEYNNTGIMTFIVNQQGKVYQKNLGPKTEKLAKAITTYDPDSTWMQAMGK